MARLGFAEEFALAAGLVQAAEGAHQSADAGSVHLGQPGQVGAQGFVPYEGRPRR